VKLKQTEIFNKQLGVLLLLMSTQLAINPRIVSAQVTPVAPPRLAPAATPKICPAALGSAIASITNRPQFSRVRWGILIQTLSSGQTLYSQDAQKYFIPASNVKLLTTAAALQQLGVNFRIRTSVNRSSKDTLRVVGRGDPSLTDAQLRELAQQLRKKGIRQIRQLIADDSYFQGDIVHPSWQWEDLQSDYGAPINSLIVNQNVFRFRLAPQTVGKPLQLTWIDTTETKQWQIINQTQTVKENPTIPIDINRDLQKPLLKIQGQLAVVSQPLIISLPVVDPAEYFLRRFRSALAAEKIKVSEILLGSASKSEPELAAIESPPLSQLLVETNQNSNNLYTEALLRALGVRQPKTQNQTTANAGLQVLKTTLTQLGVDPTTYVIADGSGLSRRNLATPEAFVQTLQAMAKLPTASVFRASLPVAGRSGTLRNRFLDTPAAGNVQAKTGTMSGVTALSGYVNASGYEPLVFSIIVNQSEQPARNLRLAVDEIVVLLTQLQRC
jgi:D-alanyl-D-alanine carboxypeptidase/D-alanyl-D-alanine-endopeptidase (penicillin-binding protein 4)